VSISDSIRRLVSSYGSTKDVARLADVSPGMLVKFLAIESLDPTVRTLFKERRLDRVMDAFWLSKVRQPSQQRRLASAIWKDHLTTHELKDAVRFTRQGHTVIAALKLVRAGRPRREHLYVVAMPFNAPRDPDAARRLTIGLRKAFPSAVIRIETGVAIVSLNESEYRKATRVSKKRGMRLTEFAAQIVRGGSRHA